MAQIDKGTFEVRFNGAVVGWVWSTGPWDAKHGEAWALVSNFPAPGAQGSPNPVVLEFHHLIGVNPADEAAFKAWLQQQGHTYQHFMKHAVTLG